MLALNWALMPRQWIWKPFIVVASYVFYAAANPKFCFLLGGATASTTLINFPDAMDWRRMLAK